MRQDREVGQGRSGSRDPSEAEEKEPREKLATLNEKDDDEDRHKVLRMVFLMWMSMGLV